MRNNIRIALTILIFQGAFFSCIPDRGQKTSDRPNIVWIFVEDMNDWMGCYGATTVPTPNIDKLAEGGIRFDRAYMPAGVCSATRSAIALGTMQTTLGVHNHRSSRQRTPDEKFHLPKHAKTIYQLMRHNGYHVINSVPKNDFNFLWPTQNQKELDNINSAYGTGAYFSESKSDLLYDVNKTTWGFSRKVWEDRPIDKPFFIQFQLLGGKGSGKYEGTKIDSDKEAVKVGKYVVFMDTSSITVMPYYADVPSVRSLIAHHYDNISQTDDEVGKIIEALKNDGLYHNTIIFFWTDHVMILPRHKQTLYEEGIRVPLIIAGPGIDKGEVRKDLISGIDITPTTLALSEIEIPEWMEGKDLLAENYCRDYVVSARDRLDYGIDRIRAVTTDQFKYIRNFMTDRSFMQPQYRDVYPFMKEMRAYYESGKMNDNERFIWAEKRVPEELYDLDNDPDEIVNLVNDPNYANELERHQEILENWIKETDDKGQYTEPVKTLKGVLKQWSAQAVNPEYDKAR